MSLTAWSGAPFQRAELEALARCALGEPDSAAERLLGALSLRSAADRARLHESFFTRF